MVVVGYQGIGKSTLSRRLKGFIDLESSCFYVDDKRYPDWYIPYCKIAIDLSDQGNTVFVSSHKEVRDYLTDHIDRYNLCTISPSHNIKDAWIEKLWARYCVSGSVKDMKAYMNAKDRFDDNIDEINSMIGIKHFIIDRIDYDLIDIVLGKNSESFRVFTNYGGTSDAEN